MSECELVGVWSRARRDLIVSQLAPTALLGFTIWLLLQGLGGAGIATRLAAAGILLASGVLGAIAQYSAASEAQAAGDELAQYSTSAVALRIAALSRWVWIPKFVTPIIFVAIFVALVVALFA